MKKYFPLLTLYILGMELLACAAPIHIVQPVAVDPKSTVAPVAVNAVPALADPVSVIQAVAVNAEVIIQPVIIDPKPVIPPVADEPEPQENSTPYADNHLFDQVVKVLHAPYENGDLFFKIFDNNTAINEHKNGLDSAQIDTQPLKPTQPVKPLPSLWSFFSSTTVTDNSKTDDSKTDDDSAQIGDNNKTIGSGTWTVTANKDIDDLDANGKKNSIVYEYENYQPNGSTIIVTGKMSGIYRSQNADTTASIAFNQNAASNVSQTVQRNANNIDDQDVLIARAMKKMGVGLHFDQLHITENSGNSEKHVGSLNFIYKYSAMNEINLGIDNYDSLVDIIFTRTHAKILFVYNGLSFILNKAQLQQLLRVNK